MRTKPVILLLAVLSALLFGSCNPNPLDVSFMEPGAEGVPTPAPIPNPNPVPEPSPEPEPTGHYVSLTNAEIIAALSDSGYTTNDFKSVKIASSSGKWTGKMNARKDLKYIQLRNNMGSHLMSPVFKRNISKIELLVTYGEDETPVQARSFYAIASNTDFSVFGAYYFNSENYITQWTNVTKYGNAASINEGAYLDQHVTLTFTGDTNSFMLIVYDGDAYIKSVKVYFKQAL